MAIGIVTKMNNGWVNTPNNGTLQDLTTNVVYQFQRPDYTGAGIPPVWNVKLYDLVTYTLVDNVATEVTLYRKHVEGTVYSLN